MLEGGTGEYTCKKTHAIRYLGGQPRKGGVRKEKKQAA